MTDSPATETAAPAAETKPAATPAISAADHAAIVAKAETKAAEVAASRATEVAEQRLREASRVLSGEKPSDPGKDFLNTFVGDPLKAFHTLKEITKAEINEEQQRVNAVKEVQYKVAQPFINDYPEINTKRKLAMVESLADQHTKRGLSYQEALQTAFKETVEELGLKSVSEQQAESNRNIFGLPRTGGLSSKSIPISEAKSTADFFTGMRDKRNSFRKKSK